MRHRLLLSACLILASAPCHANVVISPAPVPDASVVDATPTPTPTSSPTVQPGSDNDRPNRGHGSGHVRAVPYPVYINQAAPEFIVRPATPLAALYAIRCDNTVDTLAQLADGALQRFSGLEKEGSIAMVAPSANIDTQRCGEMIFDEMSVGAYVTWQSPSTNLYSLVVLNGFQGNVNGSWKRCRQYQAASIVGGAQTIAYATACKSLGGNWDILY